MEQIKTLTIIIFTSICIITLLLIDFHLASVFSEQREEANSQNSQVCMNLELRHVDEQTDVKIVRPD
jgi:hypothetical protein